MKTQHLKKLGFLSIFILSLLLVTGCKKDFFDKKLYVNLYGDYQRSAPINGLQHSRSMLKGFVAYTVPTFTVGVEAYTNNLVNDNQATEISTGNVDLLTVQARGISAFVRGTLVKDKLNF